MSAREDANPIVAPHADESAHWYSESGAPVYEVPRKDGKGMRNATLRDARTMQLAPGQSAVRRMMSAPQLVDWRIGKAIEAAERLPRAIDEDIPNWVSRVVYESGQIARDAAATGTDLHAQIERHFRGEESSVPAQRIQSYLQSVLGDFIPLTEHSVVHRRLGYGTKIDLLAQTERGLWIIDFKSKDFDEQTAQDLDIYDDHPMQLAAGAYAYDARSVDRYGICFLSRTHPGFAHLIEVPKDRVTTGWDMFRACLLLWQRKNNYCPSWARRVEIAE